MTKDVNIAAYSEQADGSWDGNGCRRRMGLPVGAGFDQVDAPVHDRYLSVAVK